MRRKHKCRLAVAREAVSAFSLPVIVARQHFPKPEHLAEANPESFPARHPKGQEAHFHCRNNSNLISSRSSLDSKAPEASSALFGGRSRAAATRDKAAGSHLSAPYNSPSSHATAKARSAVAYKPST